MSQIIDKLMTPRASPKILRGGPYGSQGQWTVTVEYRDGESTKQVDLSLAELHEWRERK